MVSFVQYNKGNVLDKLEILFIMWGLGKIERLKAKALYMILTTLVIPASLFFNVQDQVNVTKGCYI